jgi:hypothetical protein
MIRVAGVAGSTRRQSQSEREKENSFFFSRELEVGQKFQSTESSLILLEREREIYTHGKNGYTTVGSGTRMTYRRLLVSIVYIITIL